MSKPPLYAVRRRGTIGPGIAGSGDWMGEVRTSGMDDTMLFSAQQLALLLQARQFRVVLAESCTAGLVAASLGQIPGISEHLCGSAVTYRNRTKQDWLGVAASDLYEPGPVSARVTEIMARAVLQRTPEAHLSLAVTGHLGPAAPPELDGLVFTAVVSRDDAQSDLRSHVQQHRLQTCSRANRQQEATCLALAELIRVLSEKA